MTENSFWKEHIHLLMLEATSSQYCCGTFEHWQKFEQRQIFSDLHFHFYSMTVHFRLRPGASLNGTWCFFLSPVGISIETRIELSFILNWEPLPVLPLEKSGPFSCLEESSVAHHYITWNLQLVESEVCYFLLSGTCTLIEIEWHRYWTLLQ